MESSLVLALKDAEEIITDDLYLLIDGIESCFRRQSIALRSERSIVLRSVGIPASGGYTSDCLSAIGSETEGCRPLKCASCRRLDSRMGLLSPEVQAAVGAPGANNWEPPDE